MPKDLERKLQEMCKKRGWTKEQCNKYVYGTLRKTGWKPERAKKKTDNA